MIRQRILLLGLLWLSGSDACYSEPSNLQPYAPEGGRCSFLTPDGKRPVFRSFPKGKGETSVSVSLFCYDQPGCRCQLRYFDLPVTEQNLGFPEILGRYCFRKWGDADRLGKPREVLQNGHVGSEYTFIGTRAVRLRVFRAGRRIYVLSATSPVAKPEDAEPTAAVFFGAFRIHDGGTAGARTATFMEQPQANSPNGDAEEHSEEPTVNAMRILAERIAEGDRSAFDQLRDTAEELYRDIDYDKEQQRVRSNLVLMRAAFDVLGERAASGNERAFEALREALGSAELRAFVPDALGTAAAAGHAEALEMLLHHKQYGILLSSAVFALQAPAEKGNREAVDFLVGVLGNSAHRPLWQAAARGVAASAASGPQKANAALTEDDGVETPPVSEPPKPVTATTDLPEMQKSDDGSPTEQIGEVLGKSVYRNEIRTGENVRLAAELHRLFAAPVMREYRQSHQTEITPTELEIATATAYFDRKHKESVKETAAGLRAQLKAAETKLAGSELTDEERKALEMEQRRLRSRLRPPGRFFATFVLDNWKFQRHLYDRYGRGRILWQQAGLEAFDAMHQWLKSQESQGKFKITDPELRAVFYEYWTTKKHGAFLIDDKQRIRRSFLEPEWLATADSND